MRKHIVVAFGFASNPIENISYWLWFCWHPNTIAYFTIILWHKRRKYMQIAVTASPKDSKFGSEIPLMLLSQSECVFYKQAQTDLLMGPSSMVWEWRGNQETLHLWFPWKTGDAESLNSKFLLQRPQRTAYLNTPVIILNILWILAQNSALENF